MRFFFRTELLLKSYSNLFSISHALTAIAFMSSAGTFSIIEIVAAVLKWLEEYVTARDVFNQISRMEKKTKMHDVLTSFLLFNTITWPMLHVKSHVTELYANIKGKNIIIPLFVFVGHCLVCVFVLDIEPEITMHQFQRIKRKCKTSKHNKFDQDYSRFRGIWI